MASRPPRAGPPNVNISEADPKQPHTPLSTSSPLVPHRPSNNNNNNNKKSEEEEEKKNRQRKRKVKDVVDIRDSPYFKIRALVRHMRPYFIQVLRTPDFRDSTASNEIRTRMKLVMDLYKQMQIEGAKTDKGEKASCQPPLPERNQGKEHLSRLGQEVTQDEKHLDKPVPKEAGEKKLSHTPISSEKSFHSSRLLGSYVVGGSVLELNFITYTNRTVPVYYGTTKESYRRRLSKS